MEDHVNAKWSISRVTITATSRFDKRSKMPVDVPERRFLSRNYSRISSDRQRYIRNRCVSAWSRYILFDRYLSRTTFAQSRVIARVRTFRSFARRTEMLFQSLAIFRSQTHGKNED